ncbi:PQQ-binding-like beta-propeller repeat protein [Haloferula sp. A504]|uniref:outer membrane protein assembly factor BamB family protein n=1 Tax=Haloferula sp. A504 TaxID=3373601 RepID=UPI0031BCE1DD|nr:PQQ-binding-like beta-propeller repeat protein [Verrucomicrobiaceae bacterium E54]
MKPLLILVILATAATAVDSWPQFRGPDGNGVIAGPSPREWSATEGIAWKTRLPGYGWSSPVVAKGKIVVTTSAEKNGKTILGAHAYSLADGSEQWSVDLFEPTEAELKALHPKNSLATPTPLVIDEAVYVHFGHMGTAALKLDDGSTIWTRKISYPPMHGNGSSPIAAGDFIVINVDAEKDPAVYALNRNDGTTAWKTPRDAEVARKFSFCTPTLVTHDGRPQIISPGSGMVGTYRPTDGKLLWKLDYGEGFSVVPRPVVGKGHVYLATGFLKPKLLAIRLDGATGDVTDSHLAWTVDRRIPKTPSFLIANEQVIVLDDGGFLSGFDMKSGDELWRERLAGNFSASPLLCGDTLYCLTEDGIAYVLELKKDGAEILSEIDMGDRLFASPAVIDGHLILRSEKHLWKISGR